MRDYAADTLGDGSPAAPPGDCDPGDGYDDVRRGAQVTLYDGSRSTIGSSFLARGYLINKKRGYTPPVAGLPGGHYYSGYCQFSFRVRASRVAEFYGLEVSHRGVVTFTAQQLKRTGNRVALTLG